ncbi:smad nuclear interacting protein 1-like isoform X2 [Halichondria panicea]|uniref:smad nuclear interacting protein 1-like isoform X2 n=1 Tax=Halichondria panicea TaxID=6063 RepID=UPI00312B86A0
MERQREKGRELELERAAHRRDAGSSSDRERRDGHRNKDSSSRSRGRSRSNSPRIKDREVQECARDSSDRSREYGKKTYGEHRKDFKEHYRDPKHRDRMRERQKDCIRDEPRGERARHDRIRQRDDERYGEGGEGGEDSQADDSHHRKRKRGNRDEENIVQYEFGGARKKEEAGEGEGEVDKDKPDYGLSGKLTAETNTYRGVVIKYNEPEEARIPKTRWRFYGFKGEETLPTFYVHRQSAYLIGRNRTVVDMPVDHPSCSGQHAALQYRLVEYEKGDGTTGKKVRPYIIDLESTNGTYVNNNRIDTARYYELKEGDMLKFGFSSREYVILHENSEHEKLDMEEAGQENTNDES